MNAYKVEAIVDENGTVTLQGLPLKAGETVEIIVLERSLTTEKWPIPDEKISADHDYLLGLDAQMSEWLSAEDEAAYCDL